MAIILPLDWAIASELSAFIELMPGKIRRFKAISHDRLFTCRPDCFSRLYISARQTLSPELTVGEVPGTIYGLSKKGWIDYELFDVWLNNHLLCYAPTARPILDGHSSHLLPRHNSACCKASNYSFCITTQHYPYLSAP